MFLIQIANGAGATLVDVAE